MAIIAIDFGGTEVKLGLAPSERLAGDVNQRQELAPRRAAPGEHAIEDATD